MALLLLSGALLPSACSCPEGWTTDPFLGQGGCAVPTALLQWLGGLNMYGGNVMTALCLVCAVLVIWRGEMHDRRYDSGMLSFSVLSSMLHTGLGLLAHGYTMGQVCVPLGLGMLSFVSLEMPCAGRSEMSREALKVRASLQTHAI